jgi:hypothetical protein
MKLALALISFLLLIAPAGAIQINDDFAGGTNTWILGNGWSWQNPSSNTFAVRADFSGDTLCWKTNLLLDSSWSIDANVRFQSLYADGSTTGTASLGLSVNNSSPGVRLLASVQHHTSQAAYITVAYYDTSWHEVLNTGWLSGTSPSYHLKLERQPGTNTLRFTIASTNGFSFSGNSSALSESLLNSMSTPGFRVFGARADWGNLSITTPMSITSTQSMHFRSQAISAVNDLVNHFWVDNSGAGQIVNTWNGYTNSLPDLRGGLWERGTMYFVLDNLQRLTGDIALQQRLRADWQRTKTVYTAQELESCGQDSNINWASDDAGWSALMYLAAYRATGDTNALNRAKGLVNAAFARWVDDQIEGGMWYSDARQIKSLYAVGILLSSLRIYELTGERWFMESTLRCYTWIERHLLRADGLYWCDYNSSGPVGADRPNDIHEAGSVTFLGGNMGMGVLHAKLYRLTNEDEYRKRATRTAEALLNRLTQTNSVYINDRDAWAEGTFAGDWSREVLTLPGVSSKHWNVLRATADSIYSRARTTNGYYGGSWNGPADGTNSAWMRVGSTPQQIMTSASSVNMIVAAGFLESPMLSAVAPVLSVSRSAGMVKVSVTGEKAWSYQVLASPDLTTWTFATNYLSAGQRFDLIEPAVGPKNFYRAALNSDEW